MHFWKPKTILLAASLSIVFEGICWGYATTAAMGHHEDSKTMDLFRLFHFPSLLLAYDLFPVLGDMDDHVTGKEGGLEDTLGILIMIVGPLLQWFLLSLIGIWTCQRLRKIKRPSVTKS